jgi:hypothetical protein
MIVAYLVVAWIVHATCPPFLAVLVTVGMLLDVLRAPQESAVEAAPVRKPHRRR